MNKLPDKIPDKKPDEKFNKTRHYKSYLLRLWRAAGAPWEPWQAMLEDPRSGERHGFASMDALFRFLRRATSPDRQAKRDDL